MNRLMKVGGEFFWTMFWVFIVLIAGFWLLSLLANKFSGNIVGNAADWVETHATPQQ